MVVGGGVNLVHLAFGCWCVVGARTMFVAIIT